MKELDKIKKRNPLLSRPGFLIRRLHQIHTSLFIEETAGFNITPVQYSILTTLKQSGVIDQNTLSNEIGLERTSVSEVLTRLENRGLISREKSPSDRRMKLVSITVEGLKTLNDMNELVTNAHDRTIAAIPENEREKFMLQLISLVHANNHLGNAPFNIK